LQIEKRGTIKHNSQNVVHVSETESSDEEYAHTYDMGTISVSSIKGRAREVVANLTFHTQRPVAIQGKVDTGAMVACMPLSMLKEIGMDQKDLMPSTAQLRGVTGADLKTCGELKTQVTCNGITHSTTVIVTQLGNELILGLNFCKLFGLVTLADTCIQRKVSVDQPVEAVHITDECEVNYSPLLQKWQKHLPLGIKTGDPLSDLKLIFPEMFDGTVGLFDGEVDLKLSPEAKPVQLPPRAVALSVLPKLKKELDKMESDGIIRPCPETTDWVHNLVIVSKKNGDIRLCLDPKNLNKHLVRSVHYTASWEDVQHSFRHGQYFSTLDAKSGYWTKKLSADSQLLTAFNTPFKKYCFVRLPFGLSVSSEIFCEQMDRVLSDIPGTFPCADDVKVQGSTEEKHDIHLLETIDRARAAGIKFNPDKCRVKKRKIEYFGRVISSNGVEPCQKKVNAILQLASPTNKQELQSFFGTVNFMSTFIPNLSKKTHLMRGLLKKDVHFVWTSDMQQEFETIKQVIANAVSLTHFDPNKPAVIETDASLKGLGAVLIQDGRPVRFLSKSLTQTEMEYSNIERELLAVLFACEKLHVYVFGRTIYVNTDHKPLESIFQKPISLAPPRLQRMLLRLRMYNLEVKYVGASSVLLADTLSRLVKPGSDPSVPDLDVSITQVLKIRPTHLESLQEETKSDPVLSQLADYIISGWPGSMNELPEPIRPYWCFRDELAILDRLIMKGSRVVVPSALRSETLGRLHDGHQGLTATLQRARRTVYWPKLQDDISQMLLQCTECQQHGKKKPSTSEKQISVTRPMEVLGLDLMDFRGQHALVAVDFFSGYISVDYIQSETSDAVIACLNSDFRKLGLAETIISDNGPCFKSEKFNKFCNRLEIKHITSSPHYHQSNGRTERAIQTVKQVLKKCKTEVEVTLALLAYHDTPVSNDLPSPAELFFNRRINTRLGLMYQPTVLTDTQKTRLSDKRAAHLIQPKTAKDEYVPNQQIWFTEDGCSEWKPGYIESRDPLPDSYWIVNADNSRRIRRNKHDLKPRLPVAADNSQGSWPSHSCETSESVAEHVRPPSDNVADTTSSSADSGNHTSVPESQEKSTSDSAVDTLPPSSGDKPASEPAPVLVRKEVRPRCTVLSPSVAVKSPVKTRSGRHCKTNRDPDFLYNI